jgi:hypothetical protein
LRSFSLSLAIAVYKNEKIDIFQTLKSFRPWKLVMILRWSIKFSWARSGCTIGMFDLSSFPNYSTPVSMYGCFELCPIIRVKQQEQAFALRLNEAWKLLNCKFNECNAWLSLARQKLHFFIWEPLKCFQQLLLSFSRQNCLKKFIFGRLQ